MDKKTAASVFRLNSTFTRGEARDLIAAADFGPVNLPEPDTSKNGRPAISKQALKRAIEQGGGVGSYTRPGGEEISTRGVVA